MYGVSPVGSCGVLTPIRKQSRSGRCGFERHTLSKDLLELKGGRYIKLHGETARELSSSYHPFGILMFVNIVMRASCVLLFSISLYFLRKYEVDNMARKGSIWDKQGDGTKWDRKRWRNKRAAKKMLTASHHSLMMACLSLMFLCHQHHLHQRLQCWSLCDKIL